MDLHEASAWAALGCLLAGLALAQFASIRKVLALLAERLLDEVTAPPEVDQDALDLYRALRRERLLEHVARLRRILADDSHQSATRQLGNRLAYGQLLAELAEYRDAVRSPLLAPACDADPVWAPAPAAAGRGSGHYAPRVEVLDFGRRPRT